MGHLRHKLRAISRPRPAESGECRVESRLHACSVQARGSTSTTFAARVGAVGGAAFTRGVGTPPYVPWCR